jgi:hypothetical protein
MKEVTVQMTLEWSFTKKEWSDEKEQLKELKDNPNLVLGYDTLHSLFMLNDLDYPSAKNIKVKYAD